MVKSKIYAAYGSNMNLQQMKRRCPTARVIGTGFVKDYELLFRGMNGSAVATIEPKAGCMVPIVLMNIKSYDEKKLNIYEGFPNLYRKETIKVAYNGEEVGAMIYLINYGKIASPSTYYYEVIEQGYIDNGIDLSYLKRAVNKCRK